MTDVERVLLWAEAMKISEATANAVIALGFDSMEALSLISAEDIAKSKIPIGQQKHLLKSVKQAFLSSEAAGSTPVGDNEVMAEDGATARAPPQIQDGGAQGNAGPSFQTGTDSYVNEVLHQLHHQQRGQPTPTTLQGTGQSPLLSNFSWQDPQVCLKSLGQQQNVQYYDIVDFANLSGSLYSNVEDRVLSNAEGGQLVFKTGPAKSKLESLNISQWSLASNAILYRLLEDRKLAIENVLDYVSYVSNIYQLFLTHDVTSVFFFDREYRKLQSVHQFRWGTNVPHIQQVFLKPKGSVHVPNKFKGTGFSGKSNFQSRNYATQSASGKEICKKFNSRLGCSFIGCKFDHVCNIPGCSQKHSASGHATVPKNY